MATTKELEQVLGKDLGLDFKVAEARVLPLADVFYLTTNEPIKKFEAVKRDIGYKLGWASVTVEADPAKKAVKITGVKNTAPYIIQRESAAPSPERIAIGMGIEGPIWHSFQDVPHMLIAGSTGSGKSFFLHSILINLLGSGMAYKSIVPIDFKGTLNRYEKYLPPVLKPIRDVKQARVALNKLVEIMETRYAVHLKDKYKDIDAFNAAPAEEKPTDVKVLGRIFVVIDEFADMMLAVDKEGREDIERTIVRLAHKARAAGIHLIIATQRPSVDVITPLIKANIEARIALKVTDATNSRVILDKNGAEELAKGSFLYKVGTIQYGKAWAVTLPNVDAVIDAHPYYYGSKTPVVSAAGTPEYIEWRDWLANSEIDHYTDPGVTYMTAVWDEIKPVQFITAQQIFARISAKYEKNYRSVGFAAQHAIEVLAEKGMIESKIDPSTIAVNRTYKLEDKWQITNLTWKTDEERKPIVEQEQGLIDTNGQYTEKTKEKVAKVLRFATLEQRAKILGRALENL